MAGDVRQPSPMLWLHPVHLRSASDPKPLRLQSDPSGDSPLRGELLGRLLDRIAESDLASPRSSDTRDCPVTLNRGQLQVKSDLLDEPLFCISLMLADVASAPTNDLETAQGDLALQVIAVAPRAPEAELDSSWAGADEAWILCSAASDALVQLSMQGAVRWDWKDTFSTRHVLGTGSCGKVFAAAPKSELSLPERLRGQDGCAVKVLSARIDQASLRSEVLSLAMAAGHPNICGFAGVFCEVVESDPSSDGSPKSGEGSEAATPEESKHGGPLSWRIVLELLPGGDLFDSVSDHGVLQEAEAMEMLLGLLSALAHLHSLRLVHRDVKAENVLFGRSRRPVLADFGISCSVDDAAQMQCRVGSPGYVAPEVVMNLKYDEKVDVFGVGAVMYFAIDGQMVFRGSSLTQVLRRTGRCKISYATEPFGALSRGLLHLLQSLLAKSPGQRPTARTAFSTAWVLSPQQVRNGDIAKASIAALASKTTAALEAPPSAARKGAPQLLASGSMNASTQTHRTTNANNSESFVPNASLPPSSSSFQRSESFGPAQETKENNLPSLPRLKQTPEQVPVTMDCPRRVSFQTRKTQSMGGQSGPEAPASKSVWKAVMGLPARLFRSSAKVKPVEDFHGISPGPSQATDTAAQAPARTSRARRFRLFG
ncbi:PK2 [Symbiodinium sp. CCMP2456]|nr:PK2 [Symbiodinium sp. CCMP2456]